MKVLISALLLLWLLIQMSVVSSNPSPGVARGQRDQRQASSGSWIQEGSQECECKDLLPRAPKRKLTAVSRLPKKQCPCDHFKGNVKKTRHRRHHRKANKHLRACQEFITRCQLESFALPL